MSTPSVPNIQQRLEKLNPTDASYRTLLFQLLVHQDLKPHVQDLQESDLEGFVEFLDRVLSHIPETDDLFRKTLRRLQSICSNRGVLPQSHIIPSGTLSKGEAIAAGGFANVHEAELDGEKVCVKALRSYVQDTRGVTKKIFYREVVVWKSLRHPNIVPFIGVPAKVPPFEIICAWMDNSTITQYVRDNPEVDRIDLLWDVAEGLHYLHLRKIIHGDLKGANVLIDGDGHARLTDFGLASIVREDDSLRSPQSSVANATTLAAPEILGGGPVSKEGDVFTFAMVAIETFTGHSPFDTSYQAALYDIMAGKRPKRPETLDHEELWETVEKCWDREPKKRPNTSQLLEFFRTTFPRDRGSPRPQSLPSASSTWTLVDAHTEPLPVPPRKDTQDRDEPRLLDPLFEDPRGGGHLQREVSPPGTEEPVRVRARSLSQNKPPSRLKRAVHKFKKIFKSKKFSYNKDAGYSSRAPGRIIEWKDAKVGTKVGAASERRRRDCD